MEDLIAKQDLLGRIMLLRNNTRPYQNCLTLFSVRVAYWWLRDSILGACGRRARGDA